MQHYHKAQPERSAIWLYAENPNLKAAKVQSTELFDPPQYKRGHLRMGTVTPDLAQSLFGR